MTTTEKPATNYTALARYYSTRPDLTQRDVSRARFAASWAGTPEAHQYADDAARRLTTWATLT